MASTLLLETKLYRPRTPRGLVPRPRLDELLARGSAARLLLVSAPAGFGKTTLLTEWLAADGSRPVAWLSLDAFDSVPATFWTYVVAALRTVAPDVGADALTLLAATPPAPVTTVLTTLLNDLAARPGHLVLVLDDYHVVDSPEVHEGMAFLLDHLPPGLHLVIAGRADPALPLARLRAQGELVEVRAADLRFTPDEAVAYLNGKMGLQLTTDDVTALDARTEGWIVALQLAALSLQGRDDAAGFIAGFAGDARYVVDYLVEEVLHRQTADVQDFLLQTSVLDRLSGPLCDAVTERADGRAVLEALERGNLFLVPLDGQRRWYRYHHLFAEMLQARLPDSRTDVLALHRRASDWYEAQGDRDPAIEHALAGRDLERAADLIELAAPAAGRERRELTLRRWFAALPEQLFQARPQLAISQVGAQMSSGDTGGVEARLRDVQRWLDAGAAGPGPAPAGMVVRDHAELIRLPSRVAIYRAGLALLGGDPAATTAYARQALDLLAADDHLGRGAAGALIGLAAWGSGDLAAAQAGYTQSMESLQRAGHVADVLGCAITLADLQIVQGRLHDAVRTYQDALRLATDQGGPPLRGTPDMYVGIAALQVERGDIGTAHDLLRRAHDLGEHLGLPQNPHRWRLATARLRQAEGDLTGAADLLDDAVRVYAGDFSPDVRPVRALRARLWLTQGRVADALRWARERDLAADDDLSYLREFEHVTLARILLAEGRAEPAAALLDRLLAAAQVGGRVGTVVEVLVLQALAQQALSGTAAALVPLAQALTLAEPEGYARVFLDEGPALAALLGAAARRGITPAYVRRLSSAGRHPAPVGRATGLVDPLSEREADVLRLLVSDLSGPDIARVLVVSLHTVRTHTKNIYAKLGVHDRRTAVSRAHELQLLSPVRP